MSTIKINELATASISLSDFFAKADANGLATKNTIQELATVINTSGDVAFQGSLAIADTPSVDGWYFASESGTYTNAGSLVVDITDNIVIIIVSGTQTVFEKIDIPITLTIDATPTASSTNAVQSGGTFNALETKTPISILENIQSNFYSIFNGSSSFANLDSTINLELTGDSIEFKVIPANFTNGMGIIGETGLTNSQIGFWTNGRLYVRDFEGDYLTTDGFNGVATEDEEITIKLIWTVSTIDVYKDNILKKSIAKDKLILTNIGNAYNFFEGKLKDFTIVSNSVTTIIDSPYFLSDKTDLTIENISQGFLTNSQNTTLNNISQNTSDISEIKTTNENITEFIPYTNFDGSGQQVELTTPLTLEDTNDFIEFTVRVDNIGTSVSRTGMGMVGQNDGSNLNSNIGVWDTGLVYVRDSSGNWLSLNAFDSPVVNGEVFTIKLVWGASNIEVFKNGVSQGTITDGTFIVSNFGYSYFGTGVSFDGGIKNVSIKAKGVDYNYSIVFDIPSALNTSTKELQTTFLTPTEKTALSSIELDETYYELDVDGSSTGDEKFVVYNRINNDYYVGFDLEHIVDVSIQSDLWRITGATYYQFNGTSMISQSLELLTDGESEFTYRTNDGGGSPNGDFTGGVHGDEIQISSNFYANGVEITDISADIALTSCNEFYYSNLTNTKAFGTTNNETEHAKITTFKNGGYEVKNRIKWLANTDVDRWYHGISCIGKSVGEVVSNELLESATMIGDNGFDLQVTGAREYYSTNNTNNLSCFTTSSLLQPLDDDLNCTMKVWDRPSADNKYYREYIPLVDPVVNEIWQSIMIVKFNKL